MKRFFTGSGRSVPVWLALPLCLIALIILTVTNSMATEVKGPGLWLSKEKKHFFSEAHKESLLENLRQITGLNELQFSEDGQLQPGSVTNLSGGSAASRQILLRAIESGHVFFIEDHSNSSNVNFGQLDEGTVYENDSPKRRFLIWRVRLDFEDFRKMAASRQVREAFSVGFTFLHELLHGLGHKDPRSIEDVGECEEIVNQARIELNLPVRDQYFAAQLKITDNFFTVRLRFRDQARRKNLYLFFIAPPGVNAVDVTEGVVSVQKLPR